MICCSIGSCCLRRCSNIRTRWMTMQQLPGSMMTKDAVIDFFVWLGLSFIACVIVTIQLGVCIEHLTTSAIYTVIDSSASHTIGLYSVTARNTITITMQLLRMRLHGNRALRPAVSAAGRSEQVMKDKTDVIGREGCRRHWPDWCWRPAVTRAFVDARTSPDTHTHAHSRLYTYDTIQQSNVDS